MNSLRIGTWNANGLTLHRREAEILIKKNKIDVLLISETHFTKNSKFQINGYKMYHTPHPDGRAHGGTAVFVKNNIKHHEESKVSSPTLQATSVEIKEHRGRIKVCAIYCPPNQKVENDMFKNLFQSLGNKFIIGGDWNSKHYHWGSRLISPRGRSLKAAIDQLHCSVLTTGKPTHWPTDTTKAPDVLDFFVHKGISEHYMSVEENYDVEGSHLPIISTVSVNIIKKNKNPVLYNKKTDWESYQKWLENNLTLRIPMKTADDVEKATDYITKMIQQAAWKSTPELKLKEEINNFPFEIRRKIATKRKLRKKWQKSRNPDDKREINRLGREIKQSLDEIKNETFKNYVENLSATEGTDYSLWRATKQFKRPYMPVPALTNAEGRWAKSDLEKAEIFAEHLSTVFQPQSNKEDTDVNEYLEAPMQMSHPIKPTSPKEVSKMIKTLRMKKAPGYDLITSKLLKNLPKKAVVFLTSLFNAILRTSHFPDLWKASQIIMIPKPGKEPNLVNSYRPISLLPAISKIFEKILIGRMKPELKIPDHQFGFRTSHSAVQQVHRIVGKIEEVLETKQYCSAAFLDIEAAFDKVWHPGLLYKIKKFLPHSYFLLLKSYIENRIMYVKHQDECSSFKEIKAGVPQGSVIGPVLYTLYTSDLPETEHTTTATFADDTAILGISEDKDEASAKLQNQLNKTAEWLKKWRIKSNNRKGVHTTFTMRKNTCPAVTLNDEILPEKDEVKYLGLHLDRRLNWSKHLQMKRNELNLRLRKMNWLIGKRSPLTLQNKLLVYKSILKPVWTYGIELWGIASKSNRLKIQRFQNRCLRMIVNAGWYHRNDEIHEYLEVGTVEEEIANRSEKYQQRLHKHQNTLALQLLDNGNTVRRLKRTQVLDL